MVLERLWHQCLFVLKFLETALNGGRGATWWSGVAATRGVGVAARGVRVDGRLAARALVVARGLAVFELDGSEANWPKGLVGWRWNSAGANVVLGETGELACWVAVLRDERLVEAKVLGDLPGVGRVVDRE